jgi:hypothetical protein
MLRKYHHPRSRALDYNCVQVPGFCGLTLCRFRKKIENPGGYVSGRQSLRPAFVASLRIDLADEPMTSIVGQRVFLSGTLNLSSGGVSVGSVTYVFVPLGNDAGELRLRYSLDGTPKTQNVLLETTVPRYGGIRWWFVCPAHPRRESAGSRAASACLPEGRSSPVGLLTA